MDIVNSLKNSEIKVIFVFDELDKIDEKDALYDLLSDLKHLLLLKNSNSIIIAGQALYYDVISSQLIDDGLLSNIFSGTIHIPLMEINYTRNKFSDILIEEKVDETLRIYIEHLILKSKRVLRNFKNLLFQDIIFDEKGTPSLYVKEKAKVEYAFNAKLLKIIEGVINKNIVPLKYEKGLEDLLSYHLFIWVEKIKLKKEDKFLKEDIFSIFDYEDTNKYPEWCLEHMDYVSEILLDRLVTEKILVKDNDGRYRLITGEDKYAHGNELVVKHFNSFVEIERLIQDIYIDISSYSNNNETLSDVFEIIKVLESQNILERDAVSYLKDALKLKIKISKGESFEIEEVKRIDGYKSILKQIKTEIIENYIEEIVFKLNKVKFHKNMHSDYVITFSDRNVVILDLDIISRISPERLSYTILKKINSTINNKNSENFDGRRVFVFYVSKKWEHTYSKEILSLIEEHKEYADIIFFSEINSLRLLEEIKNVSEL